jgi:hypothetical protein
MDRFWGGLCLVVATLWSCSQSQPETDYLVRVAGQIVTIDQFQRRVQTAGEEAFPDAQGPDGADFSALRLRLLNQISEELIIAAHATSIGVAVSDAEIEQSVKKIKADYPDDTFKETLLENAVSFDTWKQQLAMRLLVDKVVKKEIVDRVNITGEDVAGYIQTHYPGGAPTGDDKEAVHQKIVRHLRYLKAEQLYPQWMDQLRKQYPVDINQERWDQLVKAP